MRRERIACVALTTILTLGCGDSPDVNLEFDDDDDSTFTGRQANLEPGDEFAMLTRNGAVKLGLTSDHMYIEVSEAVREHVDSMMREELSESDSRIARSISGAVRRGVANALEFDFDYRLDDIRDVEYRDGELVFDFEDPDYERSLRNMKIDDEPITRAFSEQDARAFVQAFRRVKRGETVTAGESARPAQSETDTTPDADDDDDADTAGGASF